MKKFIMSLAAVVFGFSVMTPLAQANNLTEDSNAEVGFTPGEFIIVPHPCPEPDDHLFPPHCPYPPDNNANNFFVPKIDFGVHQNQVGVDRTFYAIPAQGMNGVGRLIYGDLGAFSLTDIVGRGPITQPVADETVGHFLQLADGRGTFAGWNLSVERTEFTATEDANPTIPATDQRIGRQLAGVELIFNNMSAFSLGGTDTDVVRGATAFGTNVPVPVSGLGANVIVTAEAGQGNGVHRIQIGNSSDRAAADTAHTHRATTSNLDGTTVHATAGPLARNTGIILEVPASVPTHAANYVSTITWTFGLTP